MNITEFLKNKQILEIFRDDENPNLLEVNYLLKENNYTYIDNVPKESFNNELIDSLIERIKGHIEALQDFKEDKEIIYCGMIGDAE